MKTILLSVVASVIGTVVTDLNSYAKSLEEAIRRQEPAPKFDWKLLGARVLRGALVGILPGAGLNVVE